MLKRKRIEDDFFTKRKKSSRDFQYQISFQQNQINELNNKLDHCIRLLNDLTNQQKEILSILEPLKIYSQQNPYSDYFS